MPVDKQTISQNVTQLADALENFLDSPDNILRSEQRVGFEKLIPRLRQAVEKGLPPSSLDGYYDIATGVGKTVLYQFVTHAMLSQADAVGKKQRALIIVPTKQLLEQALESYAEFLPQYFPHTTIKNPRFDQIDFTDARVGAYFTDRKDQDNDIIITTYSSLVNDLKKAPEDRKFTPEKFGLIVLDETHKALGRGRLEAVKPFLDNAVRLGMTATTEYSAEKNVAGLLGGEQGLIHKVTVAQAHEKELISPFACYLIRTGLDIDKSAALRNKSGTGNLKDFNYAALAQALTTGMPAHQRNQKAVKLYMNWADPETGERIFGQTGIISCINRDHATEVATEFNFYLSPNRERFADPLDGTPGHENDANYNLKYQAFWDWLTKEAEIRAQKADERGDHVLAERFRTEGIDVCKTIDYKTPAEERRQIIADHKAGKVLLVAGVNIPAEGFDNRRASVLFSLVDTLSLVKKKQEGGRVLRLDPQNPTKYARIFEFADNDKNTPEDMRPVLYAETLDKDFQFRTSGESRERAKKKMPGEQDEFHEPLPVPHFETEQHRLGEDKVEIEMPEKVLELSRKRKAERAISLPEDKQDWFSGPYILNALGFEDTAKAREEVNKGLMEIATNNMDKLAAEKIDGPFTQGIIRSMFIEPSYFKENAAYLTRYLSHVLTLGKLAPPMPRSYQTWVPITELSQKAAEFGLPAVRPSAINHVLEELRRKGEMPFVYQPSPDKPAQTMRGEDFVAGPFFNGTYNCKVVNPAGVYHIVKQAAQYAQGIDVEIPGSARLRKHTITVPSIAERLHIELSDANIAAINAQLAVISEARHLNINEGHKPWIEDRPSVELITKDKEAYYVHEDLMPYLKHKLAALQQQNVKEVSDVKKPGNLTTTRVKKKFANLDDKLSLNGIFKLIGRTPTDEEWDKAEAALAERMKTDPKIEYAPVKHGISEYFVPAHSEVYAKIVTDALGLAPPLFSNSHYYDTPDFVAKKLGVSPELRPEFDKLIAEYLADPDCKEIKGPYTKGDYQGTLIHYSMQKTLRARLSELSLQTEDNSVIEKLFTHPRFVIGAVDSYYDRDKEKLNRADTMLATLAANAATMVSVSNVLDGSANNMWQMKQPPEAEKKIKLSRLIQVTDGKITKIHPTLLPFFVAALDMDVNGRGMMNRHRLFLPLTEEKKQWIPLIEDRRTFADVPSRDVDKIRPIFSQWVREGKTIETTQGPKSALETIAICYEGRQLHYYADPLILPALKEELARKQSEGLGRGTGS